MSGAVDSNIASAQDATVYENIRQTLEQARATAIRSVNNAMVSAYWEVGSLIDNAIGERAEYGKHLLKYLAERLAKEFGKGFTERNLRAMRQFHQAFPIRHTLCAELSWSHYRLLMRETNEERRIWYMDEAVRAGWSVRQLERQMATHYYDRLLATRNECASRLPPALAETPATIPHTRNACDIRRRPTDAPAIRRCGRAYTRPYVGGGCPCGYTRNSTLLWNLSDVPTEVSVSQPSTMTPMRLIRFLNKLLNRHRTM